METNYYTPDELEKYGCVVPNHTLRVYRDKLFLVLITEEGKPLCVYLKKDLYSKYELKEQPFPTNLYIVRSCSEGKEPYFFLKEKPIKKRLKSFKI